MTMDFSKYKSEYIPKDHVGNRQRQNVARALFKKDLADEFGMKVGSDTFNLIFQKAWDDGHGYGLLEIYNSFQELEAFCRAFAKMAKKEGW